MDSTGYEIQTPSLPRILCLHGGGTNARIFRAQCRVVQRLLLPYFRLVYADAPYECGPGPNVVSVYANYGPFRRWLRWLPEHAEIDNASAISDIDACILRAMDEDDAAGGTGKWVGMLGFSQGAKLAASWLYRQQILTAHKQSHPSANLSRYPDTDFRFAVLMAGPSPITDLINDPTILSSTLLSEAGAIGPARVGPRDLVEVAAEKHVLRLPTIHVHGRLDVGLHLHRDLLDAYCDHQSARVLEWNGHHRVPLKGTDVQPLIDLVLELEKEEAVLR